MLQADCPPQDEAAQLRAVARTVEVVGMDRRLLLQFIVAGRESFVDPPCPALEQIARLLDSSKKSLPPERLAALLRKLADSIDPPED